MKKSFWEKQWFRLGFGLICALPLLLRATGMENIPDGGGGGHFDADKWIRFLPRTLIFILFILPLLRCGIFFRLWNRYVYFRRACCLMLAMRVLEAIVAWDAHRDLWLLDGVIMWASLPVIKVFEILIGHPQSLLASYLEVFAWGLGAYVVLWAVIGLLFYLQVFMHYLRTRRWEYR